MAPSTVRRHLRGLVAEGLVKVEKADQPAYSGSRKRSTRAAYYTLKPENVRMDEPAGTR